MVASAKRRLAQEVVCVIGRLARFLEAFWTEWIA
jgi:hypothetical protein